MVNTEDTYNIQQMYCAIQSTAAQMMTNLQLYVFAVIGIQVMPLKCAPCTLCAVEPPAVCN